MYYIHLDLDTYYICLDLDTYYICLDPKIYLEKTEFHRP